MIEIKNVTKVYKSKGSRRKKTVALKKISCTLPDKGMVFIVGKSGSGKSTLLHLLGGLDDITSGKIIVDGNKIYKFNLKQFSNYRSTYIGFIFQDYHLLENFTVEQNILLGIDIADTDTEDDIPEILKIVDLEGMEKRYPNELSGGQQQRAAIARTLAKEPKIILADEPTGNLDANTTKHVLDTLKAISKEKLVIIVSHNLNDADNYADRIIELADGNIVRDVTKQQKYQNKFSIKDDVLYLPHHKDLTKKEINTILENTKNIKEVKQLDNGFVPTIKEQSEPRKRRIKRSQLSRENFNKLFKLFFNRHRLNKFATMFIAAAIISIFYVFQSLSTFNANQSLATQLVQEGADSLMIRKTGCAGEGQYTSKLFRIPDNEYEAFENTNYRGEIYKLYSTAISASTSSRPMQGNIYNAITSTTVVKTGYITTAYGVLNCEEDYLIDLYGQNGKLHFLAGDYPTVDYGVIITDYIADSIIKNSSSFNTYEDILGRFPNDKLYTTYISGIIDTKYRETYDSIFTEVFDLFHDEDQTNNPSSSDVSAHSQYLDFIEDVNLNLGIGYSFNRNYGNAVKSIENCNFILSNALKIGSGDAIYDTSTSSYFYTNNTLKDGEIILSLSVYNNLFKTNLTADDAKNFEPHKITIYSYEGENIYLEKEFTIAKLATSNTSYILAYVNNNDMEELLALDIFPYALYFDRLNSTVSILDTADKYNYTILSNDVSAIAVVKRGIEIFATFLDILKYCMLLLCVIYLAQFGFKNIKNNLYEIGIISALGGKNKDIGKIFILESLIVGIGIVILSAIGMYVATVSSNYLLVESFKEIFSLKIYKLKIITYQPLYVAVDLFLAIIIIFISSLSPLLYMRKVKPVNILRAKE